MLPRHQPTLHPRGLFLEATTPYCLLNVAKFQTRPGYYSLQLLIMSLYVLNGHKGGETLPQDSFLNKVPDRIQKATTDKGRGNAL